VGFSDAHFFIGNPGPPWFLTQFFSLWNKCWRSACWFNWAL